MFIQTLLMVYRSLKGVNQAQRETRGAGIKQPREGGRDLGRKTTDKGANGTGRSLPGRVVEDNAPPKGVERNKKEDVRGRRAVGGMDLEVYLFPERQ